MKIFRNTSGWITLRSSKFATESYDSFALCVLRVSSFCLEIHKRNFSKIIERLGDKVKQFEAKIAIIKLTKFFWCLENGIHHNLLGHLQESMYGRFRNLVVQWVSCSNAKH